MNLSEAAALEPAEYLVEGPVHLANFNAARQAGESAINALVPGDQAVSGGPTGTIAMNFAQLEVANSLTVALMIAWYRLSQKHGCEVRFVNLPASLQQIVAFSGLVDVLPIEPAAS